MVKLANIFLVFVFLLSCFVSMVKADIIINGDVSSGTGELVITTDVVFTMLAPSDHVSAVVFDEWAPDDGSATQLGLTPFVDIFTDASGDTTSNSSIVDGGSNSGDVTINDGRITISGSASSATSTFILKSGTYSFGGFDWNPVLEGGFSFTGNAFLVNNTATRVSDVVSTLSSVPEPGGVLLFGFALGSTVLRRKRRVCR